MLPSFGCLVRERSLLSEVLRSSLEVTAGAVGTMALPVGDLTEGIEVLASKIKTVAAREPTPGSVDLQFLPHELLATIGEHYLDSPVWHACKLCEVSPHMGKVFKDDSLWEKFLHRRFREISRSPKRWDGAVASPTEGARARSPSPTPGPSLRCSYAQLHQLEARFRGGQYGMHGELSNPHQGVAVLDLQVAPTEEDSMMAFAALRNGTIIAYDLDPARLPRPEEDGSAEPPLHASPIFELAPMEGSGGPALCCLPVGKQREHLQSPLLVAGYASGDLCSWQLPGGRPLAPAAWQHAHGGRVSALARLGTGELLSAASDGSLKAWSLDGERFGDLCRIFPGHQGPVVSVAASPFDSHLLMSGSQDRVVRLFDARTAGEAVARWRQQDWVTCVEFHPTQQDKVFSSDKAVHLWDLRCVASGEAGGGPGAFAPALAATSHRHRKLVSRFRVDPLRLVSCSLDGSVKVSSLEAPNHRVASPFATPESTPTLGPVDGQSKTEATLRTSTDYVLCIDFDATRLLVGGVDGRVDIYDFSCPSHFRRGSPLQGPSAASGMALAEALGVARRGGHRCRNEVEGLNVEFVMEEIEI